MYHSLPPSIYSTDDPPIGEDRDRRWTTVKGYLWNANRLIYAVITNERLRPHPYTDAVTISIDADLSIPEVKAVWTRTTRRLRERGVVAL